MVYKISPSGTVFLHSLGSPDSAHLIKMNVFFTGNLIDIQSDSKVTSKPGKSEAGHPSFKSFSLETSLYRQIKQNLSANIMTDWKFDFFIIFIAATLSEEVNKEAACAQCTNCAFA